MTTRPRRSSPRATLDDVAQAAGVSTATVSRFLNSPTVVTEDTRKRVEAAVRTLGYTPNFGARALAARRTDTMAAIVPTMENAIFARGLEAFQQGLAESGITLLVASSSYRPDIEADQVRTLVARGADALLLIGFDRDPEVYDFLARQEVPYVIAWAHEAGQPHPSVGFDNRGAMRTLAREVLARGHRQLGLITAERRGNDRVRNRWLGVLDAMAEADLPEDALAVYETTYSIANGRDGLDALWHGGTRPTAILCANDVLAAGALTRAAELGISVPADLSITGFDDIDLSEIVTPALTTVHVPHRRMGQIAARMLLDLRRGEEVQSEVIEAVTVLRETLGSPPATAP